MGSSAKTSAEIKKKFLEFLNSSYCDVPKSWALRFATGRDFRRQPLSIFLHGLMRLSYPPVTFQVARQKFRKVASHQMIGKTGSGRHGAIIGRKLLPWQYVNWRIALYKDRATNPWWSYESLVSTKGCYLTLHDLEIPAKRISQLDLPRS